MSELRTRPDRKKPKLLITLFMGMSFRNLVLTGILDRLTQHFEVTCLTLTTDKAMNEALSERGITIIEEDPAWTNRLWKRVFRSFETLQYYSFFQKHRPKTLEKYIARDKTTKRNFSIYFIVARALGALTSRFRFIDFFYLWFLSRKTRKQLRLFDHILTLSTDVILDKAVLRVAEGMALDRSVLVHSWDNLPSRGYLSARPTRLMVWNEEMLRQARELHGLGTEICRSIGVPQYNLYRRMAPALDQDRFWKEFPKLCKRKILLYTCSAERVFPDEDRFVDLLAEISRRRDCVLVLRLHPTERQELYGRRFAGIEDVVLDIPPGEFAAVGVQKLGRNLEGIERFILLIRNANVVINLASTISLDAMLFDRPVIGPAFNVDSQMKGRWNEAVRWYESSHFEAIAQSGAIRLAHNPAELEDLIVKYLENPTLDRDARTDMINMFCNESINPADALIQALNEGNSC